MTNSEICVRCGCYRSAHGEDERCEPVGWTFVPTPGEDKPLGIEEVVDAIRREIDRQTDGSWPVEWGSLDWVNAELDLAAMGRAAIEAYEQVRASTGGNHDQQ